MNSSTRREFQGRHLFQEPRRHVGKDPTTMAYKADEATLQRLSNTNNPKDFLPLTTTSETTMHWNPFAFCGIHHGGPVSCCGVTKKGEPCKNSVKFQDTKIGHERLTTLGREPFDLSTLQPKLYDIARVFLCARWHRQRQADQVGQQWYGAAVRNQARVPRGSRVATPSIVYPGQRQMFSASRRHLTGSDKTHRCGCQPTPSQCSHSVHL
jgi:hypothetical protein